MVEKNSAQDSPTDPLAEQQKPQNKPKPDSKTTDKKKIKQSQDQKIDNLMKSMTEMQTSLSQLVDDYYGPLNDGKVHRRSSNFRSAYSEGCMGNDDQCTDWRRNYDDYDDDPLYDDDYTGYDDKQYDDDYGCDDPYVEQFDDVEEITYGPPHRATSTPKDPNKTQKRPHSSSPNSENKRPTPLQTQDNAQGDDVDDPNEKQLDKIKAEYETTKPRVLEDVTTDPIPHQLMSTLETWMWKCYNSDEIKAAQEKARRPNNATALIPLKMEEEVFHALNPRGRAFDAKYRFIQNALMKGIQPIAIVWSKVINAITSLQSYRGDDNPFLMIMPKLSLNLLQMKAEFDLGLCLLGMANSQLGFRCWLSLKQHLSPGFRRLCDEHNPLNQWMFGGNIKTTIEDTMRVNHMMQQVAG